MSKVLVQSKFREALARTQIETVERDGVYIDQNAYRQFIDHKAYMTPQEASFLVDSKENQTGIDKGHGASYFYPAGQPFPVDDHFGGERLAPPLGEDAISTADSRQLTAAREQEEARLVRIKLMEDRKKLEAAGRSPVPDPVIAGDSTQQ